MIAVGDQTVYVSVSRRRSQMVVEE
jgi:hypothetical protein